MTALAARSDAPSRILYLAPDLSDPAVARRRSMLIAGGAQVDLAGFVRGDARLPPSEWCAEVLGRTRDAALGQRALKVLLALLQPWALRRRVAGPSVVIARNLEMLVLAWAGLHLSRSAARLCYEVLDVHKVMLGQGLKARALRWIEGFLMKRVDLLVLSSPAFDRAYFTPLQPSRVPRLILENKLLVLEDGAPAPEPPPQGPPWRVGWFGMLRCSRSLELLQRLASRRPGLVEVDIRGRPSPAVFGSDFTSAVAKAPGLTFHGAYSASELAAAYRSVHFVWAIDFYEAGQNSDWLLPNRLYEGSAHGRPLMAQREVETGHWLAAHGAGVLFENLEDGLEEFFDSLRPEAYERAADAVARIPRSALLADKRDCQALVAQLTGAARD